MTDAELRSLNAYVNGMEALVTKYECEISIINGEACNVNDPRATRNGEP